MGEGRGGGGGGGRGTAERDPLAPSRGRGVKTKKERGPLGGAKEKVHRNFLRALHESKKALKYPADSVPTLGLNTRVKATKLCLCPRALTFRLFFTLFVFSGFVFWRAFPLLPP